MPIPEEFVKKRTEVTISKASLRGLSCKRCGAALESRHLQGGYVRCEYCGHLYSLEVDGKNVA